MPISVNLWLKLFHDSDGKQARLNKAVFDFCITSVLQRDLPIGVWACPLNKNLCVLATLF